METWLLFTFESCYAHAQILLVAKIYWKLKISSYSSIIQPVNCYAKASRAAILTAIGCSVCHSGKLSLVKMTFGVLGVVLCEVFPQIECCLRHCDSKCLIGQCILYNIANNMLPFQPVGVMWSRRRVPVISRAMAFCTDCNLCSRLSGRL